MLFTVLTITIETQFILLSNLNCKHMNVWPHTLCHDLLNHCRINYSHGILVFYDYKTFSLVISLMTCSLITSF